MKTVSERPSTGLEHRKRLANSLCGLLAGTCLLLVKTQGYHVNVVGPLFISLHRRTEEQYQNLFESVDDLAERVRALGFPAPSSITEMVAMAEIVEDTGNPTAEQMVEMLVADHERIVRQIGSAHV